MAGKLAVISGFSGAGKGTVVKKLMEGREGYVLSVSMTTRSPRPGEQDGREYFFVSDEKFESMIQSDGFLEHAGFTGHYYGTPRAWVEENLQAGRDVLLEIEVQGAMQIRERFPGAILVFVTPPSAAELEARLEGRGTEDYETVTRRLNRAIEEADSISDYPYLVINDEVDACARSLHAIIHDDAKALEALQKPAASGRIIHDPEEKAWVADGFRAQLPEILARRERDAGRRPASDI